MKEEISLNVFILIYIFIVFTALAEALTCLCKKPNDLELLMIIYIIGYLSVIYKSIDKKRL
jgi:hypothetical protein